jgi:hypothetical protein
VTTGQESGGGGFRHSLFWKLLGAFVVLAVLPLAGTGVLVAVQVDRVREQADRVSRTYERRAERIAARVSDLLQRCESDLHQLAKLPRTDESYAAFAERRMTRGGRNAWMSPCTRRSASRTRAAWKRC